MSSTEPEVTSVVSEEQVAPIADQEQEAPKSELIVLNKESEGIYWISPVEIQLDQHTGYHWTLYPLGTVEETEENSARVVVMNGSIKCYVNEALEDDFHISSDNDTDKSLRATLIFVPSKPKIIQPRTDVRGQVICPDPPLCEENKHGGFGCTLLFILILLAVVGIGSYYLGHAMANSTWKFTINLT